MKKLLLLILFTAILSQLAAQQKETCREPMTEAFFRTQLKLVRKQHTDARQSAMAYELASKQCFLSKQVRDMARVLGRDDYRLEFAQLAFENTVDPENFCEVYDAFCKVSYVFKLHDFVNTLQNTREMPPQGPPPKY